MTSLSRIFRDVKGQLPTRIITANVLRVMTDPQSDQEVWVDPEANGLAQLERLDRELIIREEAIEELKQQSLALLDSAQEKARVLVEQAQFESVQVLERAQQEGFAHGQELAEIEAKQQFHVLVNEAQSVLRIAETERQERIASSESFLTELAVLAAERILEREIVREPDYLERLAKQLLAEVDKAHHIEVRVSPTDLPTLLGHRDAIEKMLLQRADCILLPDASLHVGDMIIVSEAGTIDGRLDTRLEGIRTVFRSVAKELEARDFSGKEIADL